MKYFGFDSKYLEKINGLATAIEIHQQPELWSETLEIFKDKKSELEEFLKPLLIKENLRIIFTGAGTSAYVGESIVPSLRKNSDLRFEAIGTTDIVAKPLEYLKKNQPTLLISCARSGNSPESVAAVDIVEKVVDEFYHIALTCNPEGKLVQNAKGHDNEKIILMPEKSNDKGFAMTGSFTCMMLSGLLLFENDFDKAAKEIEKTVKLGQIICNEKHEAVKKLTEKDLTNAVYLGAGSYFGLARESCLKILELTGGSITTLYETPLGFRHGPKSIVNDKSMILMYLSNDEYSRQYEIDLLKELSAEEGNQQIVGISNDNDKSINGICDTYLNLDADRYEVRDSFKMLNYILYAQMFSFMQSEKLGFGPDNPCPTGEVNRVVQGVIIHDYQN